jgi:transposase
LDEGTIRNYRKRYVEGGILGPVTDIYSGKRFHLSDNEKEQLSNYLQTKLCMDTKEIVEYIKNKFDVSYSFSGVTALLHVLGFTYKKTKAVTGKANKEAQELFILEYARLSQREKSILLTQQLSLSRIPPYKFRVHFKALNFTQ